MSIRASWPHVPNGARCRPAGPSRVVRRGSGWKTSGLLPNLISPCGERVVKRHGLLEAASALHDTTSYLPVLTAGFSKRNTPSASWSVPPHLTQFKSRGWETGEPTISVGRDAGSTGRRRGGAATLTPRGQANLDATLCRRERSLAALFRSLATRTRSLLICRLARRMDRSAGLVLIGDVSGLPGVACLDPFVCITLHLLVGLASLGALVYITVHLLTSLLTRCGLLLLCRRREGNRASGNNNHREN